MSPTRPTSPTSPTIPTSPTSPTTPLRPLPQLVWIQSLLLLQLIPLTRPLCSTPQLQCRLPNDRSDFLQHPHPLQLHSLRLLPLKLRNRMRTILKPAVLCWLECGGFVKEDAVASRAARSLMQTPMAAITADTLTALHKLYPQADHSLAAPPTLHWISLLTHSLGSECASHLTRMMLTESAARFVDRTPDRLREPIQQR